jgi:hypothetical protein
MSVNPYVLRPSGELGFNIGDSYTERATRDSKERRLEESLNLFIENLVQRAYKAKARRIEHERDHR